MATKPARSPESAGETPQRFAPLDSGNLDILAREGTHEFVHSIFAKLPRGRVLDVPAGRGALAHWLRQQGFIVTGCDLYPELFAAPGIEVRKGDLNARLPFDDGEFDYLVSLEGIEHTENPRQAIREFARVLRPGGTAIITTPNVLNIDERMKTLLNGYTSHFKPISQEFLARTRAEFTNWKTGDEVFLHIHAVSYPELRFLLESNGFEDVKVSRDAPKRKQWLYYPLVWLIRLIGAARSETKKRERWTRELQSDAILMGGNSIVVTAKRISGEQK